MGVIPVMRHSVLHWCLRGIQGWLPAAIVVSYALVMTAVVKITVCPFRIIGGIDCPTCGTTTSIGHILAGRFSQAMDGNPVGYVVLIAVFQHGIVRSLPDTKLRHCLDS